MKNKKNAGPALLRVPELPEKILNAVGSPVFVKDRSHRWIYLNKAFCDFMGRKKEELLGKTDTEFFPPEQAAIFWEKDDQTFKAGRENVNEEFFTDSAGVRHTIVTRKQVYRGEDGTEVLVGVINDITELRKANKDLSLFRNLLEHSNDAIFIVDPETAAFLDVNETACRRLGYSRGALLAMGVPDIQGIAGTPDDWKKLRARILAAGTLLTEGTHRRSDGSAFPVEVSIGGAVVEGRNYLLASARDITERKRMEEALKEVQTLRGLIPICAKCKKIRDDKGFWQKVEIYLEKRSQARFTHGLCQDCTRELYGKESWYKEEK
ncbi:MAG: PAS domain S-box protein [Elusimicrobiales bacterium]|nr:PAS domain S-box protein [Elusimicrobiales bacterium]